LAGNKTEHIKHLEFKPFSASLTGSITNFASSRDHSLALGSNYNRGLNIFAGEFVGPVAVYSEFAVLAGHCSEPALPVADVELREPKSVQHVP